MKRLLGAVAVLAVSGCECLFPQFPGGTGGGGGHTTEVPMAHEACAEAVYSTDVFDLGAALKATRQPAVADGVVETRVSPQGCVVIVDTYAGGRRTGFELKQYRGIITILDAGNPADLQFGEMTATFLSATFEADGSMHARVDGDGDGRLDGEIDERRVGGLLTSRIATSYEQATGAVVQRETFTSLSADTTHFKVEELVSGALVTVRDFDAPAAQRQMSGCYMPRPAGASDTVPCTQTDDQIKARVKAALERLADCMGKIGGSFTLDQLELFLLHDVTTDGLKIECFRDPTYFGEAKTNEGKLRVNVDMLGCDSADFVDSTLAHELMHYSRGPHDFDHTTVTGNFGPRASTYSDPIRACEALCFPGGIVTRCTCAACLRVKACDSRCSSYGGCSVYDAAGMATMSEAVGAHCGSDNSWHSTMMACQSACGGGAGSCKSYSLSCDPSCQ